MVQKLTCSPQTALYFPRADLSSRTLTCGAQLGEEHERDPDGQRQHVVRHEEDDGAEDLPPRPVQHALTRRLKQSKTKLHQLAQNTPKTSK